MRSQAKASSAGSNQHRASGRGFPSIASLIACLLAMALLPALASAEKTHFELPFSPIDGSGIGVTLNFPSGVAVDETSANVFLNDGGFGNVVDIFGSEGGTPSGLVAPFQLSGFVFGAEPSGAAVDNAASSPSKGTLYVADVENHSVKKFTRNPGTELYEAAGELTATSPAFEFPHGVAVDEAGNVYVADKGSISVVVFDPAGVQIDRIDTTASVGPPAGVAVDPSGDLFVQGYFGAKVVEYPANGSGEIEEGVFTEVLAEGATEGGQGIAADADALYVSHFRRVNQYDVDTLDLQGEFGTGVLGNPSRIAVNSAMDRIYVADGGLTRIFVFGPAITVPGVLTAAPTAITNQSVTFNGTVNPDGIELDSCVFEYGTTTSYGQSVPCAESLAAIGSGTSPVSVHADVSGLDAGTTYHYRLTAENENTISPRVGADESFTTPGALVSDMAAEAIGDTNARLVGKVNPQGESTGYRFEYVTEAEFNATGFANASVAPSPDAEVGAGAVAIAVSQEIGALIPDTTYSFRLVATNASGTTFSPSVSFRTYLPPHSFAACPNDALRVGLGQTLPDCRAYEQVTPLDKNGNSAWGNAGAYRIRAAPDGSAYMYTSEVPFPAGKGPQYVGVRGQDGWSSFWAGVGLSTLIPFGISEDLSLSFGQNGGEAVRAIDSVDGSFEEIPLTVTTTFVGASADNSKIFFQSSSGRSFDVWDRDIQTLANVGVLADSACASPPCHPPSGAIGGSYNWWPAGTSAEHLAEGGAVTSYFTQDEHVVSRDGSKAYFTTRGNGQIYLRKNPAGPGPETIHVSASQKTNGGSPDGSDAGGAQPAAFMGATPDGEKAFFTSPEMLTNDANTGPEVAYVPPAISRADIDGAPASVDLDFLPASATAVEVNATHVYWADPVASSIGRANLNGMGADPEFIKANNPRGLALNGSFVYWTNVVGGADGQGTIGRAKLDGAEVEQDFITGASNPQGIAVNATHVYWANAGSVAATRKLGRAKLDGTEVNQALTANGTTPIGGGSSDVALSGTHVFWLRTAAAIARANLDGTSPSNNYITGASSPRGLVFDGTHLYWANFGTDTIGRAKIGASAGQEVNQSFIAGAGRPQGIAVNATHLFWSDNQEATLNPGNDLYRFDAETGELIDLTPDDDAKGADVQGILGYSDDGETVYFAANGDLDGPGDAQEGDCEVTTFASNMATAKGECSIYVADEGEIRFVARVSAEQEAAYNWIPGNFKEARASVDGGALLFSSRSQLTDYDTDGTEEFYRYSLAADEIVCVSCNPTGAPPVAFPTYRSIGGGLTQVMAPYLSRNLSADGNRIFFETGEKLVAEDTNGDDACPLLFSAIFSSLPSCQDVYMWEAEGSGSCEVATADGGCFYLISTGKSPDPSFFGDASVSGDDVFFYTFEQLVRQDEDELVDVYDARVEGGFGSQHAVPPVPCEGESCRPGTSSPPQSETAGTANFAGSGNAKGRQPNRRCPRGKRKVRRAGKARCVRKAKRVRKQSKRAAKATGRASR